MTVVTSAQEMNRLAPSEPVLPPPVQVAPAQAAARNSSRAARWTKLYSRRLLTTDIFSVVWAAAGAHMVHLERTHLNLVRQPFSVPHLALTVVFGLLWLVALNWGGSRESTVIGGGTEEYKRVIQSSLGLFGGIAICSYVFDLDLPRSYVLVMLPAGLAALLLSRFTWRRWLFQHRLRGSYMSKVLAVGNVHTVRELLDELRRAPLSGYTVIGVCVRSDGSDLEKIKRSASGFATIDGVPVLGGLDEVADVVRRSGADTVAVTATAAFGPSAVRKLSWELEKTDADLVLAPALTNIAGPRIHTKPVAGLPLIHVDRPTYRGANRILKKSFDVAGSGLLLAIFSPVLLGLAIAVKVNSSGPVFFRQERIGLNGKTFRMIKFRSMVVDAEARLAALKADQLRHGSAAGNSVLFKLKDDPRITSVGRFIRRYSLDELPQLLNVVTGDMSLVGPRPPLASEVAQYADDAKRRLLVKPGMTGLWQVSGRSDLSWEETVRLDLYYVENWSITADLGILWKTAKAIRSSSGAY